MKARWLTLGAICMVFSARAEEYEARVFKADGKELPYRLLKPVNIDEQRKFPLVIFLHGVGERGTDNKIQLVHGCKQYLTPENREKYPCFVAAPQCPPNDLWVKTEWGLESHKQADEPTAALKMVVGLIAQLQKDFNIDPRRIYLTGLSMGGFGTWELCAREPELFAAAAPVCGGGDETQIPRFAKKFPVWAFHGDKDGVVKPIRSQRMVTQLKAAGADAKLTEYPGVGHDSWNKAYADPELLAWMFKQTKK